MNVKMFNPIRFFFFENSVVYDIHSLVFSLEGRAWQEPEPSHVIGMALAHCFLGKFLGVVCHCFPPFMTYVERKNITARESTEDNTTHGHSVLDN